MFDWLSINNKNKKQKTRLVYNNSPPSKRKQDNRIGAFSRRLQIKLIAIYVSARLAPSEVTLTDPT